MSEQRRDHGAVAVEWSDGLTGEFGDVRNVHVLSDLSNEDMVVILFRLGHDSLRCNEAHLGIFRVDLVELKI